MAHSIPPAVDYPEDFIADMVAIYDSLAVVLTAMSVNSGTTASIAAWVAASNLVMAKYRVAALEECLCEGLPCPPYDKNKLFFIDATPLTTG
mgnify:CR=1 FL=1